MGDYIVERGNLIVKDLAMLENFEQFTQALLALKKQMDTLIENSFHNNVRF